MHSLCSSIKNFNDLLYLQLPLATMINGRPQSKMYYQTTDDDKIFNLKSATRVTFFFFLVVPFT